MHPPQLLAANPTKGTTLLSGAVLVAATVTTGLVSGVFGLYAHTIMPGLRRADYRTFVGAFQSIDRAIINPLSDVTTARNDSVPTRPQYSPRAATRTAG